MVKVNVKWNKNSYDVDVEPSDGLETFQATLFSLTNVPAERQKLMLKGKFIKSDADLAALPPDSKLVLMGTADSIAPAPTTRVLFEEDLTEKDRVALAPSTVVSAGLVNLGNTCRAHLLHTALRSQRRVRGARLADTECVLCVLSGYMNSTLQAFRAVPELKQALIRYGSTAAGALGRGGGAEDAEALVTGQLGKLLLELEHSASSITPVMFTTVFRSSFAQFAERNSEGAWAQQDADECLTGDHRVLTRRGWQSITRVKVGDEVLSFNKDKKNKKGKRAWEMEWKPVVKLESHAVVPGKAADRLYRMQGSAMDVIATRDHRMLLACLDYRAKDGLREDTPTEYATVGELTRLPYHVNSKVTRFAYNQYRAVICAGFNAQPGVKIVIPGLERVCDWWWQQDGQLGFLQYLGFWLGDGNVNVCRGEVGISQKKKAAKQWLSQQLLPRVFPRWWRGNPERKRPGFVQYIVRCPPLYRYLRLMVVGPAGYNPRDPQQLRSYPHFTKDDGLAAEEQKSSYYSKADNSLGYGSKWTEDKMLAAMRGDTPVRRRASSSSSSPRMSTAEEVVDLVLPVDDEDVPLAVRASSLQRPASIASRTRGYCSVSDDGVAVGLGAELEVCLYCERDSTDLPCDRCIVKHHATRNAEAGDVDMRGNDDDDDAPDDDMSDVDYSPSSDSCPSESDDGESPVQGSDLPPSKKVQSTLDGFLARGRLQRPDDAELLVVEAPVSGSRSALRDITPWAANQRAAAAAVRRLPVAKSAVAKSTVEASAAASAMQSEDVQEVDGSAAEPIDLMDDDVKRDDTGAVIPLPEQRMPVDEEDEPLSAEPEPAVDSEATESEDEIEKAPATAQVGDDDDEDELQGEMPVEGKIRRAEAEVGDAAVGAALRAKGKVVWWYQPAPVVPVPVAPVAVVAAPLMLPPYPPPVPNPAGVSIPAGAAIVPWNNGWWIVINGHWFYLKRWLGDHEQVAAVWSRLSRQQAVALLEGFCRADGEWKSIRYEDDKDKSKPHEPTGQWTCSNSSFPLIDHLMLIGQLAGAAVGLRLHTKAGKRTRIDGRRVTFSVDHWQLFFSFTKPARIPMVTERLAQPVDVSADIDARGYYDWKDDGKVYCIRVADNANFLTQRLSNKRLRRGGVGVRAHSVFVGNCLQTLLQAMAHKLGPYQPPSSSASPPSSTAAPNVVDYIFGGTLSVVTRCAEADGEAERRETEAFRKLRCHIDPKIAFLQEGLMADMESELEMRSQVLGRSAVFKKTSRISSLPRYLIVQFVRFDWRKTTKQKAKVLKKVEFPLRLDVSDLCSRSLRRSLLAARRQLKDEDDAKKGLTSLNRSKNMAAIKEVARQRDRTEEKKEAAATVRMDVEAGDDESSELQETTTSGFYDLNAVITHKGRHADSGHYIGWCRASGDEKDSDRWWKYDDDNVSEVKSEEIKALSGGGDWHMAYLLMYKLDQDFAGRTLNPPDAAAKQPAAAATTPASQDETKAQPSPASS